MMPSSPAPWTAADPASTSLAALEDSFPATRTLLGAAVMRPLLERFLASLSSNGPGSQDPIAQWPGFLALGETGRVFPAAQDLARLEVQVIRAWHAADAPIAAPEQFDARLAHAEGLAELRLGLHPASAIVSSPYPIGSLWHAGRHGTRMDLTGEAAAETVLLTRRHGVVEVALLDPAAALLATAFFCRASLGEALGILMGEQPEADLSATLATLIASGMFSAIEG